MPTGHGDVRGPCRVDGALHPNGPGGPARGHSPIIIAITFHEAAHGFVAHLFGDETAWRLGRVSFNPLKHIDPVGTILLPGFLLLLHSPFLFGYAKPVPVNFKALRNPRRDIIWVAAAGPTMNLALAVLGRVDGFNQDEAECKGYEGSVVLRGLLASERDAFEALEFADGLLDACPRLVEYFRKECRSIDRV